jgi:hypothetical protein
MNFAFNRMRALRIRKLTEVWARENHVPASTQAFMDALVDRAYQELTDEIRATYYRKQA